MTEGVAVLRGGVPESTHRVHVAVVDGEGALLAHAGDPERVTYYRSAAKPLQALPVVEEGVVDALGLGGPELALCCASHNGEEPHLRAAASILEKAGLDPSALECGPQLPLGEDAARALLGRGGSPAPLHNNCSGKHAGMLALAAFRRWPVKGYRRADHPVQRRVFAEVSRWTGIPSTELRTGVDGCGVPSFAVPLRIMALSFARLALAAVEGSAPGRVVAAMTGHPFMVAGSGRLCTALMERAGTRLFVKTGAEGVYCAGAPSRGLGIALKVEDGARRASDVALLRVLEAVGLADSDDLEALSGFRSPVLLNTRGEPTGEVRAEFDLVGT